MIIESIKCQCPTHRGSIAYVRAVFRAASKESEGEIPSSSPHI